MLFLCTGYLARASSTEALRHHLGWAASTASAPGSFPVGEVNPLALDVLRRNGLRADGLRSKSWSEFSELDAPVLDFGCRLRPCGPGSVPGLAGPDHRAAHWGIADPAAVHTSDVDRTRAFSKAFHELNARLSIFVNLRLDVLDTSRSSASSITLESSISRRPSSGSGGREGAEHF